MTMKEGEGEVRQRHLKEVDDEPDQENSNNNEASTAAKSKSKKPKDTAFRQQRLPAWRPVLTPANTLPALIALGVIFIPLGIVFLCSALGVQQYVFDYSDCLSSAPVDEWGWAPGKQFEWRRVSDLTGLKLDPELDGARVKDLCQLRFSIKQRMEGPVMMYYRLTNFYQNQRLYVRSVDWRQLAGEALPAEELDLCRPLVSSAEDRVYYPCGLIANSMFNDTFGSPVSAAGRAFVFPPKGLISSGEARRYGQTSYQLSQIAPPPFWQANRRLVGEDGLYREIPNLATDERFQAWMRVAGLPIFLKPYGKSLIALPAGQYTLLLESVYQVHSYGGTKALVISTTSWTGGSNPFLGIAFIVTGSLFLIAGLSLLVRQVYRPRVLGDHRQLSWNRRQQQ